MHPADMMDEDQASSSNSPPRKTMRCSAEAGRHKISTQSSSSSTADWPTRMAEVSFVYSTRRRAEDETPSSPPALGVSPPGDPPSGEIGRPTVHQGFAGQYDFSRMESPCTRPSKSPRQVFNGRSLFDAFASRKPSHVRMPPVLPSFGELRRPLDTADPHLAFLDILWPTEGKAHSHRC